MYSLQYGLKSLPPKHQVQFTHVAEASIETLYKDLDQVQYAQFTLLVIDDKHEIQRCVLSVDDLYIFDSLQQFRRC